MRLLLEQGATVQVGLGRFSALMDAASYGNVGIVRLFLAHGADVNAQSPPSSGPPVKNGLIAIGSLTPLLLAASSGSAETVRLLLDAGADVNAKDVRGMTPLMLAVATDHPDEKIVRMLLAKKPATDVKSKAGETALDWAAKFQHPSILAAVQRASPGVELAKRTPPDVPHPSRDVRQAVEKSVALLQKNSPVFLREGGCVSCHAQNIASVAVAAARSKGIRVDEEAAAEVARGTRLQYAAAAGGMLERLDPPAVEILTQSLFGLSAERVEPDRLTDAVAHNIAAQQHTDGSWARPGILRPPTLDSRC